MIYLVDRPIKYINEECSRNSGMHHGRPVQAFGTSHSLHLKSHSGSF